MRKAILFALFIGVLFSCSEKKPAADPQVLMDADSAFSDYSVRHGYTKAFVEFADDSVVLLKPKRMPVVGKQMLMDSYRGLNDSSLVLTWKPVRAMIAESGELGYTWGFWTFVDQKNTTRGTYLTIWKKDVNGQWKYIADTGNEGLRK